VNYGVPTASIQTSIFEEAIRQVSWAEGMPHQRHVFVPQPVMGKTAAEMRAYIDGADPVTGRPVMEEVLEALTLPLIETERAAVRFDRSTPRYAEAESEEALRQLYMDSHWTDYLPIVLPTEERVQAMLAGTSHRSDEIVGRMRPTSTREAWQFDVEKVAVNAVMAGAIPAYFPLILALAASGHSARGSTTSSAASMAMVNGPIRHSIRMNWGTGALGPYNHANSTIGRAYGLLSQNLQGGSVPGQTYLGSMGNNYAYNSLTYAENEEASPWEPFHVRHGFRPYDSTVSVFGGCRATSYLLGLREAHWQEHVQNLLRGLNPHTPPALIMDPITARLFVDRAGFGTPAALEDWIWEHATLPAAVYWDDQLIQNYVYPRAQNGEMPWANYLHAAPDELVPMFRREDVHVIVVGGETNGYWRIMGCNYGKTVSIDAWQ
jgi:hypothetical protein